jgi:hypothetical protein
MPRSLRIERENGVYHVINRGNYRQDLFINEGAHRSFGHLDPVRAGMCDVGGLGDYRWSSYWYLRKPAARPEFLDPIGALCAAGGLADNARGHRSYRQYLEWLSEDAKARKEMAFDNLDRFRAEAAYQRPRHLDRSEIEYGSATACQHLCQSLAP